MDMPFIDIGAKSILVKARAKGKRSISHIVMALAANSAKDRITDIVGHGPKCRTVFDRLKLTRIPENDQFRAGAMDGFDEALHLRG